MKISQKLEYACRAMSQLAKYHDGRTLTRLEDLAQREAVSANFLVQILNDLRRAGLIESRRGKAGGYLLGRNANLITLRQVVEAVDPALLQCSVTREGDRAVLDVTDRGPGVPEALQSRIFEPFYRLPGASEREGGVGLGLSLVKEVAELHKGQIRLESVSGQGTTARLWIPLPDEAEAEDLLQSTLLHTQKHGARIAGLGRIPGLKAARRAGGELCCPAREGGRAPPRRMAPCPRR